MAQNLGMSRLGSEQQAVDGKPLATWTGRWESLIQREVGRRIWWNLVNLEWALAPSYSFCTASVAPSLIFDRKAMKANSIFSITPDQSKPHIPRTCNVHRVHPARLWSSVVLTEIIIVKTALPANIEDEDLIDGESLKAKPLNVRTKMSYQLARLKFNELAYKQIWQANNGGNPPYSWVYVFVLPDF